MRVIEQQHQRLDVVVNNAGINIRTDFRNMTDADWVRLREVNLDGIIRIARDAFPLLKASGRASLINLASIMGHRGMRTLAAYGATKGAISALTRGLAVEYAPFGIRVNALAPGFIETALTERVLRIEAFSKALLEQTPLRRFGTSEDVASAALFFASDEMRLHHRRRARHRRRHGKPRFRFYVPATVSAMSWSTTPTRAASSLAPSASSFL